MPHEHTSLTRYIGEDTRRLITTVVVVAVFMVVVGVAEARYGFLASLITISPPQQPQTQELAAPAEAITDNIVSPTPAAPTE